jgi:nucleoside phosphorylase
LDPGEDRRADVVILTAIRVEYEAVRKVEAGAVPGSTWDDWTGPSGLPIAFRSFVGQNGRPFRVAVAVAPDMGATAAVHTLLPLVHELRPRCVAMCGVCAGRRGKVQLGDVVAAERVFYHDSGKQRTDQVQQDLKVYSLRDDWKAALEGMDAAARFRDEAWFKARPITTEWREHLALVALRNGDPKPWLAVDQTLGPGDWQPIVTSLRARQMLAASGRELTEAGRGIVDQVLFEHMDELPDLTPTGTLHPFRMHIAPIGSGVRVIEDERIWTFVSQAMRKTLGIEMEAAAIGELVQRQRQHELDWLVMKGVMDFADHGRDDHFKEFAARASAECLLWFLRERLPAELAAGIDETRGALAQLTSPAVKAIIPSKDGFWEDALFAQALRDEISKHSDLARDLKYGISLRKRTVDQREFAVFASEAMSQASEFVKALTCLVDEPLRDARGPKGMPGDPEAICYVAARMAEVYRAALEWGISWSGLECDWRNARQFIELMPRYLGGILIAIERLPVDIEKQIEVARTYRGDAPATLRVDFTLDIPDGLQRQVEHEIDRMTGRSPSQWFRVVIAVVACILMARYCGA